MLDILFTIDPLNPDLALIQKAAALLKKGELVAFPTETVYGLGADALNPMAVEKIFRAKGRPQDNPLIVHVASIEQAKEVSYFCERALTLAHYFWPGPLTLVLPSKSVVPDVTRGGLDSVAVRMPMHRIALDLITQTRSPLAAPSANQSGRPSPTRAQRVLEDLQSNVSLILDGGACRIGVESTVLDLTTETPLILRPGGISLESLTQIIGAVAYPQDKKEIHKSPGTRYRHYAPEIPLVLWEEGVPLKAIVSERWENCGYMGMASPPFPFGQTIIHLTVESYTQGLYEGLRSLERSGVELIVAQVPSTEGIGAALCDRLRRAAGR